MDIDDLKFAELTGRILKPYAKRAHTESLQFLKWFLENIFRQDPQDADDACVDRKHDKGVDGILVNDVLEEIYVIQSKVKQKEKATLGDTEIKEFVGTLEQFSSEESVQVLYDGNSNQELKSALSRNLIKEKLSRGYNVQGIFCSNVQLNNDGEMYSSSIKNLTVYDANKICNEYISISAPVGIQESFDFDTSDSEKIKYQTSEGVLSRIFLASALQLTHLKGISDGSLFSLNVRLSLGNTKVNKGLLSSIRNKKEHKNFPLYHNGITILCDSFEEESSNTLKIKNYVVVNGAQSLSSLLQAKGSITQDLKILVKIVALGNVPELGENITQNSNNQNAIKPRDLRSNHGIQQRLKKEISDLSFKNIVYEVKRGEENKGKDPISNEYAGLAILAIDLGEPWNCHQKYKVMDESHSKIFGRSDVTGSKVVLISCLMRSIEGQLGEFKDKVFGHYNLTKYFLAYAVAEIFKESKIGVSVFHDSKSLFDINKVEEFVEMFLEISSTTIVDLEAEIEDLLEDEKFDYKRDLKSPKWCRSMNNKLKATHRKDVKRNKAKSVDDLLLGII